MKLRGTAEGLIGADASGTLLGMMDDEHGDGMAPLEFAQKREQRGDLGSCGAFGCRCAITARQRAPSTCNAMVER
jgi:hypothetical protein